MQNRTISVLAAALAAVVVTITSLFVPSPSRAANVRADAAMVLCVADREPEQSTKLHRTYLLVRELIRQSLLIAARDELGLATRDAALGEPFLAEPIARSVEIKMELLPPDSAIATVIFSNNAEESAPLTFPLPFGPQGLGVGYMDLLVSCEEASRGLFAETLRKRGIDGTANPRDSKSAPPPKVEERLEQLNELAYYGILRDTHRAIRQNGESEALLGVLVRAYANLGELTRYHLTASSKVFAARSLLYAQRMVAANPKSASAMWHRAYALTLCGLHVHALEDLASAQTLSAASDEKAPEFVALLDASCRFQTARLAELATASVAHKNLAVYLSLLSIEDIGSPVLRIEYGQILLEAVPDCFRVVDAMTSAGGVGLKHVTTEAGLRALIAGAPQRIAQIDQLPKAVSARLADAQQPDAHPPIAAAAALADSLIHSAEADRVEPSLAMLGEMLRQIAFVQVYRRAHFEVSSLGWDQSDFARDVQPLIDAHPYRAAVEEVNADRDEDRARMLRGIKFSDVTWSAMPIIRQVNDTDRKAMPARAATDQAWAHADMTAYDLQQKVVRQGRNDSRDRRSFALAVLMISPYSPVAIAALIEHDPEYAATQIDRWETLHPDHPALHAAAARLHTRLKEYDKARPALESYVRIAPDEWAYEMLAANYLAQNDEANWLRTLEESLSKPDYSLSHATTNEEIAKHFMKSGDLERAQKHADAAAESGRSNSLLLAAQIAEKRGNWGRAHDLIRENATHYNRPERWLGWCLANDRGDLRAAREAAIASAPALLARGDRESIISAATTYLYAGERDAAANALRQSLEKFGDSWAGLQLALLLNDRKDIAGRDEVLERIISKGPGVAINGRFRNELVVAAKLMKAALAPGGKLDAGAADAVVESVEPASDRANVEYFLGRAFELIGDQQRARAYFSACTARGGVDQTNVTLARVRLRTIDQGGDKK